MVWLRLPGGEAGLDSLQTAHMHAEEKELLVLAAGGFGLGGVLILYNYAENRWVEKIA